MDVVILVIAPCVVLMAAPIIAAHLWATRAIALNHLNYDSPEWLITACVICVVTAGLMLVAAYPVFQPSRSKLLVIVLLAGLLGNMSAERWVKSRIAAARKKVGWHSDIDELQTASK